MRFVQTPPLLRIAVIGAGVTGSVVVRGLQSEPDVEIVCIDRGPQETRAGTGLNVGPNGLQALARVDPELLSALESASLPWQQWRAGLTDGRQIFNLSLASVAERNGIRIRWSHLYHLLRDKLTVDVRYSTQPTEMGYADDGTLFVASEDLLTGTRERWDGFDLILGCDGRYSEVRQTFWGHPPQPEHLGVCIYRVLVDNTSDNLIDDYEQWFYQGSRLLTFRIPTGEVYIAGSFPIPKGEDVPEAAKNPEFLRRCYTPPQGLGREAEFLVNAVCDHVPDIHWARIQAIPTVYGDAGGQVLCLGDSSHAMVPTLGQGATQSFEDACLFAALARQHLTQARQAGTRVNVPALVREAESLRQERVEFVKQFSVEASDSLLVGSDPELELRRKMEPPFLNKLRKLYGEIPWIEDTQGLFRSV
jgi:salicylate hydroxylase